MNENQRPREGSSAQQGEHYDRILEAYDEHYFDAASEAYRREFILDPLLADVDLRGKRVADLASGSGHTTLELMRRFPGVVVDGYDISPEACAQYTKNTGRPSYIADLTKGYDGEHQYDAAIVIGGLHHCVVDLPAALGSIAAMLKPGGSLLMFEPNGKFALQSLRRVWYRLDRYFDADTEAALVHDELLALADGAFTCQRVRHFGGPAFFLVLNSLVFRIPLGLKRVIAGPLTQLERGYNRLPGRVAFSSFTAHWRRAT